MVFKSVAILTSNYLRKVGIPQSVHIGTGYKHTCGGGDQSVTTTADEHARPIYPAKVRYGFLPDEWFTFFYAKTGATGPYMFGLGLLNYLFSKEIYICEHEFYSGLSLGIMSIAAVKKLGPSVAKYCDREIEKVEKNWNYMHELEIKHLQGLIEDEQTEQWRADGSILLLQVKKENIALQLEAAYREALMKIYKHVKQDLDYQVACKNIEIRINHKHMVLWVVDQVEKGLPKTDEETRKKNRADVSAMALRIK